MDEQDIIRYLEGEFTPEEGAAMREWLDASGENRLFFNETKVLWGVSRVEHFRKEEQLNNAWSVFSENVRNSGARRRTRIIVRTIKYAAVLILLIVSAVVLW